jgi:LPS export ABC transporter protein LptC
MRKLAMNAIINTSLLINIFKSFCGISIILILNSCENNIEVINSLTNRKELPFVSANNAEGVYSDSGKVKFKMIAKEYEMYVNVDKPYTLFPKGLTVYLYDSLMQIESVINAQYAIYHQKEKLWEARNDVEAKNVKKNEQINTEEMFWDQNKAIIYSNKFTRIVNQDGVFTGEGGFIASETLSWWKLKGIKGTVNIKESDNNEKNP